MSGVLRRQVFERTGIVVVVTGVHLSAISIAAQRKVEFTDGPHEPIIVELVQTPPQRVADLPMIEARFDLKQDPGPQLIIPPPSQIVPNPYPDIPEKAGEGDVAGVAPAKPEGGAPTTEQADTDAMFPLPSMEAQNTLRSLLCDRLSSDEDAACAEHGTGEQVELAGSLAVDRWALDTEVLPAALEYTGDAPLLTTVSLLQGDRFADSPYRVTKSITPVGGNTSPFALGPMAPVNQATRDMSGRAISLPNEVWGD